MTEKTAATEPLLGEFTPPSLEQWHEEVIRLLKGAPFDKKMLTETFEGFTIAPMYTEADVPPPDRLGKPGFAPYLRGTTPLGPSGGRWKIAQEILLPNAEAFNSALQHDMKRGQEAVSLVLDEAAQAGLDPDRAESGQVGRNGTSIATMRELAKALDGIDLTENELYLQAGSAALPVYSLLLALVNERDLDLTKLSGSVGMDPLAGLARFGTLPLSLGRCWDELALITRHAADNAPALRTLVARGSVWHDAGASLSQELAFTLAAAVQTLREMEARGLDLETAAPRIQFDLSVGANFFPEIAKLRALRILWHRVLEASGAGELAGSLHLFARTGRYNKTLFDPHVNILRSTVETFAAVMGGADAIHTDPFDQPLGLPSELSRRLARNTQLVLREESHFDQVIDPAGGSWAIENLTDQIAEKAWEIFQQVEARGGLRKALAEGWVQHEIEAVEKKRRERLQSGKDSLVGTTRYPNALESSPKLNHPDYDALHRDRSAAVQSVRVASSDVTELQVLELLNGIVSTDKTEIVDKLVEAAHMGATLGELTRSLRHDDDERPNAETLTPRRAADQFENLRVSLLNWRESHPDAPAQIFLACMGPRGRYTPRLDFARSFFEVGGFAVNADSTFSTPEEAAKGAQQAGCPVVVIVGTDDTYDEVVEPLAKALKGSSNHVILAGRPVEKLEQFSAAGVDEFIHIRSDALVTLTNLAKTIGVL